MGLWAWLKNKLGSAAKDEQPAIPSTGAEALDRASPSPGSAHKRSWLRSRLPLLPVAGIDYGTCFTKIVLQDENNGIIEAIRSPSGEFLHPSLIGYAEGNLYGPGAVNASNALPYLKMLASEKGPKANQTLVFSDEVRSLQERSDWGDVLHGLLAWYFMHVVNSIRTQLGDNQSRFHDFDDSRESPGDQLAMNLGIPEVQENSGTEQIMVSALRTAAAVHVLLGAAPAAYMPLEEWLATCSEAMADTSYRASSDLIRGYPEVAAGIQAVLRSPSAADCIYITLDVGGGTVDMNVFRRTTPAGSHGVSDLSECLGYYAADVSPWGAERRKGAPNPFDGIARLKDLEDTQWGLDPATRKDVWHGFEEQVRQVMAFARDKQPNLGRLPAQRTYDTSRIYMWGGGATIQDYRSCLISTLQQDIQEPVILNLPVPEKLRRAVTDMEPSRLAVAFGLSHPWINLSKIKPPDAFADAPRSQTRTFFPKNPDDPGYWTMDSID